MEFRKSMHAKAWGLAAATAGAVALTSLAALDDAPPNATAQRAGAIVEQWHAQFAHGLQVSLRAVADGNDRPATGRTAEAAPASAATNRLQPVVAEPAFAAKAR